MIKFFKSLFVAPENISKGVDALISAGDAIVYTKEEKATDALSQILAGWKDQYGPRAVTRRLLALMFAASFIFDLKVVLIQAIWFYTMDIGSKDLLFFLIQLIKYQAYVILTITTFYFGSYGWERIKLLGKKG